MVVFPVGFAVSGAGVFSCAIPRRQDLDAFDVPSHPGFYGIGKQAIWFGPDPRKQVSCRGFVVVIIIDESGQLPLASGDGVETKMPRTVAGHVLTAASQRK